MTDIHNKEDIKIRVSKWVTLKKQQGFTQKKLTEEIGLNNPSIISTWSKQKSAIGLSVIEQILNFDKNLNARWLILGEGEMYTVYKTNNENSIFDEGSSQYLLNETIKNLIESKDDQIRMLKEQVVFLKHLIEK